MKTDVLFPELGRPLSVHRISIVWPLLLCVVATVMIILATVHVFSEGLSQPFFNAILFVTLITSVIMYLMAYHSFGRRVIVYEKGIEAITGVGTRMWQWEQIDGVVIRAQERRDPIQSQMMGAERYTRIQVYVQGRTVLRLTDAYSDVHNLGLSIMKMTLPHLLLNATKAIDRGETVKFGNAWISHQGIAKRGRSPLSWHRISNFSIRNGFLELRYDVSKKRRLSLHGRHNSHVMVELIVILTEKYGAPISVYKEYEKEDTPRYLP